MKLQQLPLGPTRIAGNMCLTSGLAVIGATATAFSTTVIVSYVIDGIIRALAAQTNTALSALADADLPASSRPYLQPSGLTGFYTQPANTTVFYLIGVIAAGTVRVVQGTFGGPQVSGNTGGAQQIKPDGYTALGDGTLPDCPDGFVPFAILKVISGASVYVPGTTALTSIGTFLNCQSLSSLDRPF